MSYTFTQHMGRQPLIVTERHVMQGNTGHGKTTFDVHCAHMIQVCAGRWQTTHCVQG